MLMCRARQNLALGFYQRTGVLFESIYQSVGMIFKVIILENKMY